MFLGGISLINTNYMVRWCQMGPQQYWTHQAEENRAATWSHAQALRQAQHGITAVHGGSELFLDGRPYLIHLHDLRPSQDLSPRLPKKWRVSNCLEFKKHQRKPITRLTATDYITAACWFHPWCSPWFSPHVPVHIHRTCQAIASASNSSHSSGKWSRSWENWIWSPALSQAEIGFFQPPEYQHGRLN